MIGRVESLLREGTVVYFYALSEASSYVEVLSSDNVVSPPGQELASRSLLCPELKSYPQSELLALQGADKGRPLSSMTFTSLVSNVSVRH